MKRYIGFAILNIIVRCVLEYFNATQHIWYLIGGIMGILLCVIIGK